MHPPEVSVIPYVVITLIPASVASSKRVLLAGLPPTNTDLHFCRCSNNFLSPNNARCSWVGTIAV